MIQWYFYINFILYHSYICTWQIFELNFLSLKWNSVCLLFQLVFKVWYHDFENLISCMSISQIKYSFSPKRKRECLKVWAFGGTRVSVTYSIIKTYKYFKVNRPWEKEPRRPCVSSHRHFWSLKEKNERARRGRTWSTKWLLPVK